VPPQQEP
jgi:hypothetical protein